MTRNAALLFALPQAESEVIAAIAHTPWYSIRLHDTHEWLNDKSIRASSVTIRADQVIRLESLDIQLTNIQEAFRLCIRLVDSRNEQESNSEPLVIAGGNGALLNHFRMLPRPEHIRLVWNRLEYPIVGAGAASGKSVSVPSGLVIEGANGQLLICQDDLPTWLRLVWDGELVRNALMQGEHIDTLR